MVEYASLPKFPIADAAEERRCVLAGGDDYELLFTADPSERARLQALDAGVVLKRIGTVSAEPGVRVDGAPPARDAGHGFDHFAAAPDGPG